ncbi:hypothetical protein RUND412_004900 [Rhizina undulata]
MSLKKRCQIQLKARDKEGNRISDTNRCRFEVHRSSCSPSSFLTKNHTGMFRIDLSPKIELAELVQQFLDSLNPDFPDPPLEDTFDYPPTRRCNPSTIPAPYTSNDFERPGWMPKDIKPPSNIPSLSRAQYPMPATKDGKPIQWEKPGPSWLHTAWEYDLFPLYKLENGKWYDYRNTVDLD